MLDQYSTMDIVMFIYMTWGIILFIIILMVSSIMEVYNDKLYSEDDSVIVLIFMPIILPILILHGSWWVFTHGLVFIIKTGVKYVSKIITFASK